MLNDFKNNLSDMQSGIIKKQIRKRPKLFRLWQKTNRFIKMVNEDCVGLYAAQAAFFTVLSAVPFVMLVIVCLKSFIDMDVRELISPVLEVLPETVSEYILQVISEIVYRSESFAVLSAAAVAILYSSSRGTMAIYGGLNRVFGSKKTYSWLRARAISFIYNILFIVAIVAAMVILLFGNAIYNFLDSGFLIIHYIFNIVFRFKFLIFFVAFALAFAAVYAFLPQRKAKYKSQLTGAVVASAGWIVFSYLFSLYIEYFSKYSVVYGSLTALALLMLWVYFCQYMFLIGAEINKYVNSRNRRR